MRYRYIFLILTCKILFGQLSITGSLKPTGMFRISDQSRMDLPFRLAELKLGYTMGDFDFMLNSAVEYRWGDNNPVFDLREAYIVWFPNWGEVKFGKQIHAWGVVDGNNPTDNLNAYDYYFMFLPGTDRKVGALSAAMTVYSGDWQLEGVIIPDHIPNRMPFNEPDFPFQISEPSKSDATDKTLPYEKIENPIEYGLRLKTTVGETDVGISYFNGKDRSFSLLGVDTFNIIKIDPKIGYRATSVFGLNMVTFIDDITIRAEVGYFTTENNYQESWFQFFETKAEYVQYVIQFEYRLVNSSTIGAQLIGNHVLNAVGQTVDLLTMGQTTLNTDNFIPGLGTPFAMIAEQSLSIVGSETFFDESLELGYNLLINLEEKGQMVGINAAYSLIENWSIDGSVSYFKGDDKPENSFKQLEDFSHFQLQLSYSF